MISDSNKDKTHAGSEDDEEISSAESAARTRTNGIFPYQRSVHFILDERGEIH